MSRMTILLAATLLIGSAGCANMTDESLAVSEMLNVARCNKIDAGLTVVSWKQLAEIRGSVLIDMSTPDEAEADVPLLVAISKGVQPTPGYKLELTNARIEQATDKRTAVIELDWRTPDPDSVQAQVITHPCIVVGMENAELSNIRAVISTGEVIGELEL